MLVKNMTLDIWTWFGTLLAWGWRSLKSFPESSLNVYSISIPMIKRSVGTIYVMIFISSPAKPTNTQKPNNRYQNSSIGKKHIPNLQNKS